IEAQQAGVAREARKIGDDTIEAAAEDALEHGAAIVGLDEGAGALDDAAVLHAGGTGRLAGAAIEATIDVGNEGITEGETAGVHLQDLVDAAAGRIHLGAEDAIRGAVIEAQAAVDAGLVELPGGTVAGDGGERGSCHWIAAIVVIDVIAVIRARTFHD